MSGFFSWKVPKRFWPFIGWLSLAAVVVGVITYRFWSVPNGLSEAEMLSAAASGNLHPLHLTAEQVVDLPWALLQWLSIKLFGLSMFAIRLPAVVLSVLSVGVFSLVAYRAFVRKHGTAVAMISGAVFASLPAFLLMARTGTAAIFTIFAVIVIIAAAGEVMWLNPENRATKILSLFWKMVLGGSLALLLYLPGGVYFAVGFVLFGLLHPKCRVRFIRTKIWKLIVGAVVGLALLTPLGIAIVTQAMNGNVTIIKSLLDLDFGAWKADNFKEVGLMIGGWLPDFRAGIISPMLSVAALLLVLLGLWRLIRNFFSARSYLIIGMLLLSLALTIVNPTQGYWLIVPLGLTATIGAALLLEIWFSRFPRNPYARNFGGLILFVLFASLVWSNVSVFSWSVHYDRGLAQSYSQEFAAVREYIANNNDKEIEIVVANAQVSFYQVLAQKYANVSVISDNINGNDLVKRLDEKTGDMLLLASSNALPDATPKYIATGSLAENSVLFRVY